MSQVPTQPKPVAVLRREGRSHRTKQELAKREKAEQELLSGKELKERKEVKDNQDAHKEFIRIKKLLKEIGKNDALYEPVINRYCLIQAEVKDQERRREFLYNLVEEMQHEHKEIKQTYEATIMEIQDAGEKLEAQKEMTKAMAKCMNNILAVSEEADEIDKLIHRKRAMLFNIEKENIMTIASSLRTVPKKEEKKKSALARALAD